MVALVLPFALAEDLISCSEPDCVGVHNTGLLDSNGCTIYECPILNVTTNSSVPISTCSDSDGGLNYYVRGDINSLDYEGKPFIHSDWCIPQNDSAYQLFAGYLEENYCREDQKADVKMINCPNGCSNGACVMGEDITEKITCNFKGSKTENKCYLAGQFTDADQGTKWCMGTDSCTINFTAPKGEKITWKSSCGKYQYTVQDGDDEKITFDCTSGELNVTSTVESYFRKAYWKCANGTKSYEGGESSCKPYSLWKMYALSFCGGQSGNVVAFSMSNECYPNGIIPIEQPTTPEPNVVSDAVNCKQDTDCPQLSVVSEDGKPNFPVYKCINNICTVPLN